MDKYNFNFKILGDIDAKIFDAITREEATDIGIVYTTALIKEIQIDINRLKNFELKNIAIFYLGTSLYVNHLINGDVEINIETEESTNVIELAYDKVTELLNEIERIYPQTEHLHIDISVPVEVRKLS